MATNPFNSNMTTAAPGRGPVSPFGSGSSNPFGAASTGAPAPSTSTSTTPNPFSANPYGSTANPFAANGSNTENMFSTPGSGTINLGAVPTASTAQTTLSPQVQTMLNGGGGYSPQVLQSMEATATQSAADAGIQQDAQMKRALAAQGITGSPAAAGYEAGVAEQTGQQQQQNLAQVLQNQGEAEIGQQNNAAGLDTQVNLSNMQSANSQALANAQMLYNAILANQQARLGTQFNIYGSAG